MVFIVKLSYKGRAIVQYLNYIHTIFTIEIIFYQILGEMIITWGDQVLSSFYFIFLNYEKLHKVALS
jgi:hypothetical protein